MLLRNLLLPYFGIINSQVELVRAATEVNFILAASDEATDLVVADGVVKFRLPFPMVIERVTGSCGTAPVGAALEFDLLKNGTSVFSTLPTIDAGENTTLTAATQSVLDAAQVNCLLDDELSVNIEQIGSSTAGKGLKVTVKGYR